jgi:ParB-like chromosome segregation protein Spo0J
MARAVRKRQDQLKREEQDKKPVSVSDMLNLENEIPRGVLAYVDPNRIDPNPFQPRKTKDPQKLASLAASIKERGILQPLLAVRAPGGRLTLIAGERRLEAARKVGLQRVPVLIVEHRPNRASQPEQLRLDEPAQKNFKFNAQDAIIDAVVENIQREELDAISEGESYRLLVNEYNWTHQEVAIRIGKTRAYVTMRISLAEELSPQARELLTTGFVSAFNGASELEGPEPDNLSPAITGQNHVTQQSLADSDDVTRVTIGEKRNNTVKAKPGIDVLRNVARLPKDLQVVAAQAIIAETARLGQLPTTRQVAVLLKNLTQPPVNPASKEDVQQLKLDFGPGFELEVPRWLSSANTDLAKLLEENQAVNTNGINTNNKETGKTAEPEVEVLRRLITLYERDLSRLKSRLAEEEQTENQT